MVLNESEALFRRYTRTVVATSRLQRKRSSGPNDHITVNCDRQYRLPVQKLITNGLRDDACKGGKLSLTCHSCVLFFPTRALNGRTHARVSVEPQPHPPLHLAPPGHPRMLTLKLGCALILRRLCCRSASAVVYNTAEPSATRNAGKTWLERPPERFVLVFISSTVEFQM